MSTLTPYLIGIAGPSGAGKSELARLLARGLPAQIIALDSFYGELAHLPLEERARANFDVPDALDFELLQRTLAALAAGCEADLPVYDFARHVRTSVRERVRPSEFLIIEGLFALYWEGLRRLLGTKVFVTAADEVCFERRIWRDVRERGRTAESVRRQYETTVRPMAEAYVLPTRSFADVVVRGTDSIECSAAAVLEHVKPRRRTFAG